MQINTRGSQVQADAGSGAGLRYRPFRGRLRQYRLLDSDNDAD
ncbi:hypothetical protein ACW5XW_13610 [Aeromonas piscicola]|uniref:Uncharacterized protein n=1 Tax=Aeromonas piscicola TaxID=600645 RepID=A0ABT7QAY8_9GAMM|nr:hypothetical protein [Aeromonas piscicola]MDM5130928.1 hypothetical protein [Aeromonas piscicola]